MKWNSFKRGEIQIYHADFLFFHIFILNISILTLFILKIQPIAAVKQHLMHILI